MDSQSLDLSIIDQGPILLLCWKPSTDSTILYVTKNIFILSGYTVDELKLESKNWIDIVHPEDRHIALNHIVKITSSVDHSLPKRQYRIKTKSSEVRWIEEQYKILKENDGYSIFLMSYIIDVTERRHIESVAKQADAKWKAILDASPDQCMLLSSKGSIEYINFTFSELTRDEIIGTSVLNSVSKEYQPLVLRCFEQVMYTGKSVKFETHLKDIKGAKSSYCSTMSAVIDNGKVVNVVMVTSSVKEKRNLLLALEESLESYQLLADRLPDIVYRVLFEAGGQVEYFNERVLDITGYSQEELNDSKNCACESIIIAEDRGRVFLELDAAKKAKREYELSYCIRHKNGSKRYLLDRGQFVDQTNSCPAHFDGVIFDISERKKQEIELILSREIAEKASSAKTQFLLRMSHELRTPMNAIIGYGELMRDDDRTPLSHEQHQCLHNLLTAGHHLLDIINDTIDFSRIDSGALEMYVVAIDWRIVIDRCIENITLYA